jgi:Zn ribbon nucleic-acid-binding protein
MERVLVECLSCGQQRARVVPEGKIVSSSDCPRCGYAGWAPAGALSEELRRRLRELPPDERRRQLAAA